MIIFPLFLEKMFVGLAFITGSNKYWLNQVVGKAQGLSFIVHKDGRSLALECR
jgi:hypothetical protein